MMNLDKLRERAIDARAEADRAAKAFKATPNAQTLTAKEIAAQLAANADEAVTREEERLAAEDFAAKRARYADALSRASHAGFTSAVEPLIEAFLKAETAIRGIYQELLRSADEQGVASTHAANFGADVGEQLPRHHSPLTRDDILGLLTQRLRALYGGDAGQRVASLVAY